MDALSNKKFEPLTCDALSKVIGGAKKWVLVATTTSWKCMDAQCDNILVYTEQLLECYDKKGNVIEAKWERDPKKK